MKIVVIVLLLLFSVAVANAAVNIVYNDTYVTSPSNSSDGIAWLNGYIAVSLAGVESGTDTICWDWNGDNIYTACFAQNDTSLNNCKTAFSEVGTACSAYSCASNGLNNPHVMDTVGSPTEGYMKAGYFKCGAVKSKNVPSNNAARYLIMEPRQYQCVGNTSYADRGFYHKNQTATSAWWNFSASISCSALKSCNASLAGINAAFFSSGTVAPSAPCSLSCGNNICESWENSSNCPADCRPFFNITRVLLNQSSSFCRGQNVTFSIRGRNIGSASGVSYIGGGVKYPNNSSCNTEFKSINLTTGQNGTVYLNWQIPLNVSYGKYYFNIAASWDRCVSKGITNGCYNNGGCNGTQSSYNPLLSYNVTGCPNINVSPAYLVYDI